ncbi:hypothetical protein Tco_0879030, partial [Tanacetum coccineum]
IAMDEIGEIEVEETRGDVGVSASNICALAIPIVSNIVNNDDSDKNDDAIGKLHADSHNRMSNKNDLDDEEMLMNNAKNYANMPNIDNNVVDLSSRPRTSRFEDWNEENAVITNIVGFNSCVPYLVYITKHTGWYDNNKEIAYLMLVNINPILQKKLEHFDAYDMLQEP